ncbi:MAG: nickel pincer cofactor biosynthesis protein LarC [Myxococcota bacterium]
MTTETSATRHPQILFVDCFSGIAGDMWAGALLDLGFPRGALDEALGALDLHGYRIEVSQTKRSSIAAAKFNVIVEEPQPARDYAQIQALLAASRLPEGVRERALRAFDRLADAEAAVHASDKAHVHFHEVGAVDSIVDMVTVCAGLEYFGADVVSAPVPLGRGFVNTQHGRLPVPAPATVLCLRDVPTVDGNSATEITTPTGACLVATSASRFSTWPNIRPTAVGWGSGEKDFADRPNLLRLVLGDDLSADARPVVAIEATLDDSTGEIVAGALERAFAAGALDAWTTPVTMKKGRPGVVVIVLTERGQAHPMSHLLLRETSSIGVRYHEVHRIERPRKRITIETRFGPIDLKVADGDGLPRHVAPEYESCRRAANTHDVAIKEVFQAAIAAATK